MIHVKKNNHFVPKMYLRQWARDGKRVYVYRLLVSSSKVPEWKQAHIRSIALHEHLYTRIAGGAQSDEFERWLDAEFESPAATALEAVRTGQRLRRDDWWNLVRFVAAQDVRTPARLQQSMQRWRESVPQMVDAVTKEVIARAEQGKPIRSGGTREKMAASSLLPVRVSTQRAADGDGGLLRVETDIGRGYWLFQMKHLLTKTADVLHAHRWSTMVAPDGLEWLTSDDPVVKLNYASEDEFNFGGGWASKGSEIFIPLTPKRLMYTRIGQKDLAREIIITPSLAQLINRMIVRHAHRAVFASLPVDSVAGFRPRMVDPIAVDHEKNQWAEWARQ